MLGASFSRQENKLLDARLFIPTTSCWSSELGSYGYLLHGRPPGEVPFPGLKTLLSEPIGLDPDSPDPYMHLDSVYVDIQSQAVENLKMVGVGDMKFVIGIVIQLCSEMPLELIIRFWETMGIWCWP